MNRIVLRVTLVLLGGVILNSCFQNNEDILDGSITSLRVSRDTVFFDTLLSDVQSPTRGFTIYNPHERAVEISRIFLGMGSASDYNLTVNGEAGKSFNNEVIFGGDSMLVLIDLVISPDDLDTTYASNDSVIFEFNGTQRDVKLRSWGQDHISPPTDTIKSNVTWNAVRPYYLTKNVYVDSGYTLTIAAGTRIFIDPWDSIKVAGKLNIEGELGNEVIITSSRGDQAYRHLSGQWGAIMVLPNSRGNINYAIISNAVNGIKVGFEAFENNCVVNISNTIIKNIQINGIQSFVSEMNAYNTVVNNCGTYLLACLGGNYSFVNCTFTNAPNAFRGQNEPSVAFSDNWEFGRFAVNWPLDLVMYNSIIWGEQREELFVGDQTTATQRVFLRNNLIRTLDQSYAIGDANIISQEINYPRFYDVLDQDFRLDTLSNVVDKGIKIDSIQFDILGQERDDFPDLGAYEIADSLKAMN